MSRVAQPLCRGGEQKWSKRSSTVSTSVRTIARATSTARAGCHCTAGRRRLRTYNSAEVWIIFRIELSEKSTERHRPAKRAMAAPRSVQFGKHCKCTFGPAGSGAMLQPLRDSSALLRAANFASLAETLHRDGYLFLPGSLQKAQVSAARLKVIDHLDRHGGVLDPSADSREGVLREGCGQGCVPFLEGRNEVTHCPEVIRVFEGPSLKHGANAQTSPKTPQKRLRTDCKVCCATCMPSRSTNHNGVY